jgi:hypothetical protein
MLRALVTWAHWEPSEARPAPAGLAIPRSLWIASIVLRASFIVTLLILIGHSSMPQSEGFWTLYDTPTDLLRLGLGVAAFAWTAVQLFVLPRDAHAYQTWFYIGLVGTPFLIVCIIGTW